MLIEYNIVTNRLIQSLTLIRILQSIHLIAVDYYTVTKLLILNVQLVTELVHTLDLL